MSVTDQFTNRFDFSTQILETFYDLIDKPESPYDVHATWIYATSVNITWDWSKKSIGGRDLTSNQFRVYYKNADVAGAPAATTDMVSNKTFHY